jgi:hypothetical protein
MSDAKPRLEVKAVIVCDDVRVEANGKEILIGVYHDVFVDRFPVQLQLTLWTEFQARETVKVPVKFRVIGEHDEQFLSGGMIVGADKPGMASFAVGFALALQIPTILRYQINQYDEPEWITAREISVTKRPEK